jgi:uncharacterized protein YjdB
MTDKPTDVRRTFGPRTVPLMQAVIAASALALTAAASVRADAPAARAAQKTAAKPVAQPSPKPVLKAVPTQITAQTAAQFVKPAGGGTGGALPGAGPGAGSQQPASGSTSGSSQQPASGSTSGQQAGTGSTGSSQQPASGSTTGQQAGTGSSGSSPQGSAGSAGAAQTAAAAAGASSIVFDLWGNVEGMGGVTAQRDQWLGTKGQNRRLEALMVRPTPPSWPSCLQLTYMAHIPGVGDTGWYTAPQLVGTVGRGLRMEGIAFKTAGTCAADYTVEYRCHAAGLGDTSPMADGAFCGTRGQGRQLEAVVVTVRKVSAGNQQVAPSSPGVSSVSFDTTAGMTQKFGAPPVTSMTALPDQWNGTKGEGRSLLSFAVRPRSTWPACLKVEYMAHIAGIGDTGWFEAPSAINKQSRIEGLAFRPAGTCANDYIVEYQCHVEGIGDTSRMSNGSLCGTRGQGRRVEAFVLTVRKK